MYTLAYYVYCGLLSILPVERRELLAAAARELQSRQQGQWPQQLTLTPALTPTLTLTVALTLRP